MARTSQTARKPHRPRPPRKQTHQFNDHAGNEYTVVDPFASGISPPHVITKLSIHLYSLEPLLPNAEVIGRELLYSSDIVDWGNARNWWPRVDVYAPLESIEACIEHHRREKAYRKEAKEEMHRAVAAGAPSEEEGQAAVAKLRGKEPLPHIVPTWCPRNGVPLLRYLAHSSYRSFVLVVPRGSSTWDDIKERGLWMVEFDRNMPRAHEIKEELIYEDVEALTENDKKPVAVDNAPRGPPVNIERLWVDSRHAEPDSVTTLEQKWMEYVLALWDCTYRPVECEGCEDDLLEHDCEVEMSEHFFNEDGNCVECSKIPGNL
ncbi:hypothetical protein BDV59DRAFT_155814 [Aspergillus ambiguus]|uniref:uncharacterized protein n=1 Tax=Aspergillus ambiguus TaxID=176160 RepID=UPI003CCDD0BF